LFKSSLFISFLFISPHLVAQLCTGSLGDPIVNIDFGAGANPGPALAAATTNYIYFSDDCPNDGFYAVRNNTTACFATTWHSLSADHTGNANGYFMLVNASLQPSDFYLDTVKNLCPATTYEFAAWIMNIILPAACSGSSAQPNITFSIERTDGTVLQSYNSNNIPPSDNPTWKQYGFFFTTPSGVTDVVLRMRNNAAGGCGNDLALDDITFRPCGPLLAAYVTGTSSQNVHHCEGSAASFSFTCSVSPGFNNPEYQWQKSNDGFSYSDIAGANSAVLSVSYFSTVWPGTYYYRCAVAAAGNINSTSCRVSSGAVMVIIDAKPTLVVTGNSPVCSRNNILLSASGGSVYNWAGPNNFTSTSPSPVILNAQAVNAGRYYVSAQNDAGCTGLDSVDVVVNTSPDVSVSFSDSLICPGDSLHLFSFGGGTYLWTPAETLSADNIPDPIAKPADSTNYRVVVTNAVGCTDTAYVKIDIAKKPVISAGPDRVIFTGGSISLAGSISGNVSGFSWSPNLYIDDIHSLTPLVNPPSGLRYILSAGNSCAAASDSVNVKVYDDIFIPNSFTPNGDGKNDKWNITVPYPQNNFQLIVFNRYGMIVFETKNGSSGCDGKYKGKDQPEGVYTYMLLLTGTTPAIKGTVLLLR
jgi:gliding motility-associated-like protein